MVTFKANVVSFEANVVSFIPDEMSFEPQMMSFEADRVKSRPELPISLPEETMFVRLVTFSMREVVISRSSGRKGGTMKTVTTIASVLLLASAVAAGQQTALHPLVTKAEYERWQKELSNWGRWGKDDEMGTLNLITPAKRKQAVGLVKDGISVSLASDESAEKGPDNPCPIEWSMLTATASIAMDRVGFPCIHGAGHTHFDSFAHVFFDGKMWNGYLVAGLVTKEGGAGRIRFLP